eukprot:CAMPEP_0168180016 /NCGR_PEP_ID=MMETSP0139_2-20121125/10230_1 /TAXON_ID=44445 /ORGANISM="Pseudo-nitzschia australis, Strain 10249 10 AB" /LENGTH=203 /DNA_ID=CAMNT_0008100041 /DNA_START=85 /DNA_END=696 /DNA_ORIENTATION=+
MTTIFSSWCVVVFLASTSLRVVHVRVHAAYFSFETSHAIVSCKDHGIEAGTSLQEQCVDYCYPDAMEAYDYADPDEDPDYVVRNTVCRCYKDGESPSAPKRKTSECATKAQVWDKKKPVLKCLEDYQISSLSTCQEYCKRIDPVSYGFGGGSGDHYCKCGSTDVCSDTEPTSAAFAAVATKSGTAIASVIASTALALFVFVLA